MKKYTAQRPAAHGADTTTPSAEIHFMGLQLIVVGGTSGDALNYCENYLETLQAVCANTNVDTGLKPNNLYELLEPARLLVVAASQLMTCERGAA